MEAAAAADDAARLRDHLQERRRRRLARQLARQAARPSDYRRDCERPAAAGRRAPRPMKTIDE
eukprot:12872092-Heterocapsa_arctica.AAC.1